MAFRDPLEQRVRLLAGAPLQRNHHSGEKPMKQQTHAWLHDTGATWGEWRHFCGADDIL